MNFPLDGSKRLFVLDTTVLMHDPSAFFRFKEHDLYLLVFLNDDTLYAIICYVSGLVVAKVGWLAPYRV